METRQGRIASALRTGIAAGLAFASPVAAFGGVNFPQAAQAPAQSAAQADPLVFNSDRMLVVIRVAEANVVDFEVTMGKVKEVLAASEKPERKRQAAGWKILKATDPQDGAISFFFVLEKVEKGVSYDPFKILGEALPAEEVGALFQKVGPGLRGISAAPLGPIISMGGGG